MSKDKSADETEVPKKKAKIKATPVYSNGYVEPPKADDKPVDRSAILEGRYLSLDDRGKPHAVVSRQIAEEFEKTLGDALEVNGTPLTIVGIYYCGSLLLDVTIAVDIDVLRGMMNYDANTLCRERGIADYFEQVVNAGAKPKQAANWIQGDVGRHANERGISIEKLDLPASRLASMIELVDSGTISRQAAAKTMLPHLLTEGGEPSALVEELGLAQVHDEDILVDAARKAIEANPKAVTDFQAGKEKALGAMQGFVMRETRGKANPKRVEEILRSLLENT